jgi:hypothetical protein
MKYEKIKKSLKICSLENANIFQLFLPDKLFSDKVYTAKKKFGLRFSIEK